MLKKNDEVPFSCKKCGHNWNILRVNIKKNGFPKRCPNLGCSMDNVEYECNCDGDCGEDCICKGACKTKKSYSKKSGGSCDGCSGCSH